MVIRSVFNSEKLPTWSSWNIIYFEGIYIQTVINLHRTEHKPWSVAMNHLNQLDLDLLHNAKCECFNLWGWDKYALLILAGSNKSYIKKSSDLAIKNKNQENNHILNELQIPSSLKSSSCLKQTRQEIQEMLWPLCSVVSSKEKKQKTLSWLQIWYVIEISQYNQIY